MNISDYIVYLWLVPVSFQIVLPLAVLAGWSIGRLLSLLRGERRASVNPLPLHAG